MPHAYSNTTPAHIVSTLHKKEVLVIGESLGAEMISHTMFVQQPDEAQTTPSMPTRRGRSFSPLHQNTYLKHCSVCSARRRLNCLEMRKISRKLVRNRRNDRGVSTGG